ncbi:MAG: ribosome assembly RNA-binding protein YhbY [Nitrospirota bacterium]|nr:ribosome assembly RNA-binding protein YhbY [Nitrospirota bacterium]
MPEPELTGKQRRFLRAHANTLKATVQIGREGLTDGVVTTIAGEFEHRELVKVAIGKNADCDAREIAFELAARAEAYWVQTLGRTIVLYRAADPPELRLPAA